MLACIVGKRGNAFEEDRSKTPWIFKDCKRKSFIVPFLSNKYAGKMRNFHLFIVNISVLYVNLSLATDAIVSAY